MDGASHACRVQKWGNSLAVRIPKLLAKDAEVSVFISYRREDTEGQARALFQGLTARLGKDSVFMDVDSIALGRDFGDVLQERLASCYIMFALIGREWADGKDKSGRRVLIMPAICPPGNSSGPQAQYSSHTFAATGRSHAGCRAVARRPQRLGVPQWVRA